MYDIETQSKIVIGSSNVIRHGGWEKGLGSAKDPSVVERTNVCGVWGEVLDKMVYKHGVCEVCWRV